MNRLTMPAMAAGILALLVRAAGASGIAKGPYLMSPTLSSITVCWVSSTNARGTVEFAPERQTGAASTTGTVREERPTEYHRVILNGLQAYTRYRYSVECDGQTETGSFITAAPRNQPFKFVAYGDNRTQPAVHASVLAGIMKFEPDFIINTGDQVANGSNENLWTEFWQVVHKALSHTA